MKYLLDDESETHSKKIRPFKVVSFTPFQISVINLNEFIEKRAQSIQKVMREGIEAAAQYMKAKHEELGVTAEWRQSFDVAVLATFLGVPWGFCGGGEKGIRTHDSWCTYPDGFETNPDIEVFCGGENEKMAAAAACWRQGNLHRQWFNNSRIARLLSVCFSGAEWSHSHFLASIPAGQGVQHATDNPCVQKHTRFREHSARCVHPIGVMITDFLNCSVCGGPMRRVKVLPSGLAGLVRYKCTCGHWEDVKDDHPREWCEARSARTPSPSAQDHAMDLSGEAPRAKGLHFATQPCWRRATLRVGGDKIQRRCWERVGDLWWVFRAWHSTPGAE